MLFEFDLGLLPPGCSFTAVRFAVSLADERFAAVALECDTALPPNATRQVARLRPAWLERLRLASTTRATVSGMHSSHFSWTYGAAGHALWLRSYTMHALLESPPDAAGVAGVVSVEAEISHEPGTDSRRQVAVGETHLHFTERLLAESAPDSLARLCAAVDTYEPYRRSRREAERMQQRALAVLERALDQTCLNERPIDVRREGSRSFVVLSAGTVPTVFSALVRGL